MEKRKTRRFGLSNERINEVDEGAAFLGEIEQRRGGKITFKTFSTFYADNLGNVRDYGVFLYMVDGTFFFQDFEHENTFLGFKLRKRKNEPEYVMFEGSFSPLDVVSFRTVNKKAARNCALGFRDFSKLRKANPVLGFFTETATEIKLKDGRTMYFQFMDKSVRNIVNQMKDDDKGENNGCIQSL